MDDVPRVALKRFLPSPDIANEASPFKKRKTSHEHTVFLDPLKPQAVVEASLPSPYLSNKALPPTTSPPTSPVLDAPVSHVLLKGSLPSPDFSNEASPSKNREPSQDHITTSSSKSNIHDPPVLLAVPKTFLPSPELTNEASSSKKRTPSQEHFTSFSTFSAPFNPSRQTFPNLSESQGEGTYRSVTNWLQEIRSPPRRSMPMPPPHQDATQEEDNVILITDENNDGLLKVLATDSGQNPSTFEAPGHLNAIPTAIPGSPSSIPSWSDYHTVVARSRSADSVDKTPTIHSDDSDYRDCILKYHGIIVHDPAVPPPTLVEEMALEILNRERKEDTTTAEELRYIKADFNAVQRSQEAKIVQYATRHFPRVRKYMTPALEEVITTGTNSQWSTVAMPYTTGTHAVVAPKTDYHYGFTLFAFGEGISADIVDHERIKPLSHPNPDDYFPFLLIEFKAEITGGSLLHAADQAAGAGALCINALRQFLCLSHPGLYEPPMLDTIHFSCVLNAEVAAIWIHWFQPAEPNAPKHTLGTFRSAVVARRFLQEASQLADFLRMLKNIVDWGFETRLPLLKDALVRMVPSYLDWTRVPQRTGRSDRSAKSVVSKGG